MEHINLLEDSFIDAVSKLSEGVAGAVTLLVALGKTSAKYDVATRLLGWRAPLFFIDAWELRGSKLATYFRDNAKGDIRRALLLIRFRQLGLVTPSRWLEGGWSDDEFAKLEAQVLRRIPNFRSKDAEEE